MTIDSISDAVLQRILAASIFGGLLAAAVIVRVATGLISRRMAKRGGHAVASEVLYAFRNTGALFLVAASVALGLQALPEADQWQSEIQIGWKVVAILLIAHGASSAARAALTWYAVSVAPRTGTSFDDRMLPLARRIIVVSLYGIGALVALDAVGVSISPFLGGLGITGLAVALALQPTLGNFFAGTYVLSDGAIKVGDYIELNGGPAGYVIEVGWRSTKIQTWLNNLVIIPNAVMADTIVTNYSGPAVEMNVLVTCGVSYASDLKRVNELALEVAREVIEANDEAVKTEDPWFGFDRFGDSNVEFWVFLQARDRIGSFIVTNDFIKRLHARFLAEGIEINYPVRKLVFDDGLPPELAARRTSS